MWWHPKKLRSRYLCPACGQSFLKQNVSAGHMQRICWKSPSLCKGWNVMDNAFGSCQKWARTSDFHPVNFCVVDQREGHSLQQICPSLFNPLNVSTDAAKAARDEAFCSNTFAELALAKTNQNGFNTKHWSDMSELISFSPFSFRFCFSGSKTTLRGGF